MLKALLLSCCLVLFMAPSHTAAVQIYTEKVAPYSYFKDGKLVGFSVDLVQELQRRVGHQQSIRVVPWLRAVRALETEKPVMVFAMARNSSREKKYQWVGPIGEIRLNFLVDANDQRELNDLNIARELRAVGVVDGAIEQALLRNHQFQNLVPVNSYDTGFRMMINKRIDIWAGNEWVLLYKLHNYPGSESKFRSIGTELSAPLFLAFSNSTPVAEVERWQAALDQMKLDGRFEQIVARNKHFFSHHQLGESPEVHSN